MREPILAHAGEVLAERKAFEALSAEEKDAVIECLKTLQVLPLGVRDRVVDGDFRAREWPPSRR